MGEQVVAWAGVATAKAEIKLITKMIANLVFFIN
jgi:hypothetical protein